MYEAARQEKTSEKMSEKTPTASEAKNVGGYLDVRPDDAEAKSPDTSQAKTGNIQQAWVASLVSSARLHAYDAPPWGARADERMKSN